MDISNIFLSLKDDYKESIISIVLLFPLAYIDCWRISTSFTQVDIIQQIIIAAGVDIILMFYGVTFSIITICIINQSFKYPVLASVVIYPSTLTTAFVLIDNITSVQKFILCLGTVSFATCLGVLITRLLIRRSFHK